MRAREIINEGPVWDAVKSAARKLFRVGKPSRSQIDKSAISSLERGMTQLRNPDYNSIDKLMRHISKEYKMNVQRLHDIFVKHHGMIPDDWIAKKNKKWWH